MNNQKQNQLVNMESCLERAAYAILFHQKDYSFDFVISSFFPPEILEAHHQLHQVRVAFESDGRFILHDTEDGLFVGRKLESITQMELRMQRGVEQWKDLMSSYFKEFNCDVKLCMLSQIVKRPEDVPKHVKLIDVLNSDLQRRFLLITSSPKIDNKGVNDIIVKYKHTPLEVEFYHEQWRENVIVFLLQQLVAIPLVTIGTHVTKPKNLGKNQKLIDIVKLDPHPQQRFEITVDASHNSLTRLSLTAEYCCERWRQQIHQLWRSASPSAQTAARLMDLDFSRTPRPAPLSASGSAGKGQYSLRDAILKDPLQRFRHAPDYAQLQRMVNQSPQQQTQQRLGYSRLQQQRQLQPTVPLLTHPRPGHGVHPQQPPATRGQGVQRHQSELHAAGYNNQGFQQQRKQVPSHSQRPRQGYEHRESGVLSASRANFLSPHHRGQAPPSTSGFSNPQVQPPPGLATFAAPHTYMHTHTPPSPPGYGAVHPESKVNIYSSGSIDDVQNSQYLPRVNDYDDSIAPLPLEKSVSVEFSEYCTPPNFLDFLDDENNMSSSNNTNTSFSPSHSSSLSALPAAVVSLDPYEKEYSGIPSLLNLRFLSDAL